ncbi:hypothetical protein Tdes44962_MAKER03635 [Teratosphaeria destructans]|uniref:Uncharacterized protein n=1 Tax=Teratosphaeria destructans TaxID=418781 RepID=A0A9W7W148_9PEZI|nr:hypothetical protein Tdes44962_MAKER03635 [Teratosphaeria destructans]
MAGTSTYFLGAFVALVAVAGAYIYLFGIPKEWKRAAEEKALETMGENKMSYMAKDAIGQIPTDDQREVKELKQGISNAVGGGLQNPLGKFAGNTADDATKDFTGR